jgi:signal transduction histidine kinase
MEVKANSGELEEAQREATKLRKINAALMSRVERSMDQQFNAFALFETAIALDHQVRERTQQLRDALHSIEKTNESLYRAKQKAEAASSLKSSVLISVTHDLLQPLNAARLTLSALAELMQAREATLLVEQVDRSLITLEDLLRSLLEIAKLDAGVHLSSFAASSTRSRRSKVFRCGFVLRRSLLPPMR